MSVDSKRLVVIGGGSGLSLAIVGLAAGEGARVIVTPGSRDQVDTRYARARSEPLLLWFDDLHPAGEVSVLLPEFLARDNRGSQLLVVRTDPDLNAERPPGPGEATGELARGEAVSLRGPDRDDVQGIITELSGLMPSGAKAEVGRQAAAGNPLPAREAMRLLAAEAAVEEPGGLGVPIRGSVRAVIQRRLEPLSADAVQVLSAAAVVGREFDLSLVGPACELPAGRVLGALSEAVALGVVGEEAGAVGRYRFSHPLVHEVVYAGLPIHVRTKLHRRVGETIERLFGTGPGAHVAELARHFGEAAPAGEAAKALSYARLAGERAMGMHAYEEAAFQYQRALGAVRFAGPDEPARCELLLRIGQTQSRAGNYQQARESCLQAAELSRELGAPEQLARAALGFGEPQVEGGLVNRQLVGLLREALDGLSPADSPLRARLLARLSLELTFSDKPQATEPLSRQAVQMARRVGDPRSLAGALRARWMAVWGPGGLDERSALAAEILRLAEETGNQEMGLAGRARRATSSLESGDIRRVEADIAAHARLADEFRMPVHQWTATTMRAMRALLQGSFEEAERLADAALTLQPGRPNAQFAHLDQITLLRWEQGRLSELRDTWQGFVNQFPEAAFARGLLALADAELGQRDDARRGVQFLAARIPELPRNGLWLPALALASLVSAHLNEASAAGSLYPVLLPYAGHVIAITMPHPVICLGSASLYLGLLATVTSSWAEAGDHFEAAAGAHDRLGARPLLARTHHEHARMLVRRGRAGDRTRALGLLDQALAAADSLGMARVSEGIQALLAVQAGETAAGSAAGAVGRPHAAGRYVFRREGEYWTICYEGSLVRLRDAKGLRHLARLLAHPAREFHATDLEAADNQAAPSRPRDRAGAGELEVRPDLGDAGELLDATAKAAYKARLDELQAELDEAERFNDPVRAASARRERDFLVRELARAVGLGGRDRRAASHAERARLNATRAIRAAIANLARASPALGRHLSATIRTGRYCCYTPDPRVPVAWVL